MKKVLLTLFVVLLGLTLTYGIADALSGVCSNCHTMHNSQNGVVEKSTGPFDQLLRDSCVGCHTAANNVNIGTAPLSAPKVLSTGGVPGVINAGGDFYWVNLAENATQAPKGHNVIDLPGITGKDTIMPNTTPPGWDAAASSGVTFGPDSKTLAVANGDVAWNSQLTCAGTYGCHGYQDGSTSSLGIQGAHHSNTGGTATRASAPADMGSSYRFLAKIKGLEDTDWEGGGTLSPSNHNEYYGWNDTGTRDTSASGGWGGKDTISWLCAKCHGDFHSKITLTASTSSPWARHPTDIALWQGGETNTYTAYIPAVPIARNTVPSASASGIGSTDVVMCLSCHRAHGSAENDLLRFTYSDMVTGDSTETGGCMACHTDKND